MQRVRLIRRLGENLPVGLPRGRELASLLMLDCRGDCLLSGHPPYQTALAFERQPQRHRRPKHVDGRSN
jgi:hypothetical protein